MKLHNTLLALASAAWIGASPALAAGAANSHQHGHGSAGIGEAGQASQVTRTVHIEMRDSMHLCRPSCR